MKKLLTNVLLLLCIIMSNQPDLNASNHLNTVNLSECMDCITAPVLICPSTYFGCPADNLDPINTGFPIAMPGDTNCPAPIVTYSDVLVTDTPCSKVIHRTWLAEYPPGSASIKLHSQCQQTLILEDNELPVIENCPIDITVDLAGNCDGIVTWNIPTATDNCGIQFFTTTHFSGISFPLGITPVTYTAQDWCGQQQTCNFNVTVEGSCCGSLNINCPIDRSVCVGGDTSPTNTGFATPITNDPSCPIPEITFADSILTTGPCVGAMLIQRSWTVTDTIDSTITNSCIQLISVSDLQSPTITSIPSDITVTGIGTTCSVAVTWTEPEAFDNCDIATFESNFNSGDLFSEGSSLVIYTATDNCGNTTQAAFLVNVICQLASCTTLPSIVCPSTYTSCPSDTIPDPIISGSAVALPGNIDCNQPNLTFIDLITSNGPCLDAKTIDRTWTASDPDNPALSTSCIQSIVLADNSVPTIINIPIDITVTGSGTGCSESISWTEPSANDNCGVASLSSNFLNGSNFPSGSNEVIYTATDNCGNTTTQSFTVTVQCGGSCNSVPILTCPSNFVGCPSGTAPSPIISGFPTTSPGSVDCNQPVLSFIDSVVSTGTCPGVRTIERTWISTDLENTSLITTCVQTISLEDNDAPIITNLPADITVNGLNGGCTVPVSWTLPTATDDCGLLSLDSDYINGQNFPEGTTSVTFTAVDNCGNTSSASFNVVVICSTQCNVLPTIICPNNFVSCPSLTAPNPAESGFGVALPGSIDCTQPILTFIDNITSTGPCSGAMTIERVWIATDQINTNLNVNCIQTITLEDNEIPNITNVPTDFTVNGFGNSCLVPVSWNTPTFDDNCGIASATSNIQSGSFLPEGITTIIYTAIDNCGLASTATFDITVNCLSSCNDAPIITGPQNYWTCPTANIPTPNESGWATAVPGSIDCAIPIITYSDSILNSNLCAGASVIQRTWTATDPSNSSLFDTSIQIISLEDTNPPYFVYCPSDVTVNANNSSCSANVIWSAVTASDNCSLPNLTATDQNGNSVASGSLFYEGVNVVTYSAIDLCNNTAECVFNVIVSCAPSCNVAPVITCPTNKTICPGSSTSTSILGWANATGGPNCPIPDVSFQDIIASTGACVGEKIINRTWTASYSSNNNLTSSCVQIISAIDETAPTFNNCPSDITVNNSSTVVDWYEPTATDFCSTPVVTSSHYPGQYFPVGTTTVTYSAVDNCGNINYCSFNVTVQNNGCNTAPSIACPSDKEICPWSSTSTSILGWANATGGLNCPTPDVNFQDIIVSSGPCAGEKTINRTWTASYSSGSNLSSSCIQVISAKDVTAPSFFDCPSDITVGSNSPAVVWNEPTAIDFCSTPYVTSSHSSGQSFPIGTTTVTYSAIDNCGNVNYCNFDVTVQNNNCNTAPNITCPIDKTICPGSNSSASILGYATAYAGQNCPIPVVNFQDIITSTGPCNGEKIINRTWTASYNSGSNLTTSCVQIITAKDDLAPTFNNCPNDITVTNNTIIVTWNTPTVTDLCSTPTVSSSHQSGQYFPVGTTTVTYTAIDNCNNTSYCSFNVTVETDNSATITCPNDISLTCDSTGGAIATWDAPEYTGSCSSCIPNNTINGFVYMGTFNGNQYYCSTSQATWPEAQQICNNNGGHLASINSSEENQFLADILTLQSAWIGLSDHNLEGEFVWDNGDSLTYTNWYVNQPNDYNYNQDYVEMLNNGLWNDQYNNYALEYIMEIPCTFIQQSGGPVPGSFLTGGNYTVSYILSDACGANDTCSFEIIVDGGLSIECPDDISVKAPSNSNGVVVDWEEPKVNTCCGSCANSAGGPIQGFVYMGAFNGHHYYCSLQKDLWENANLNCIKNGGYLAVINDEYENSYLANLLSTETAWIGLSDIITEGSYEWVNGDNLNYTHWYPGQPNNYNDDQDYIELLNTGEWNDQYNSYSLEYIMEIPGCLDVIQTSGPTPGSTLMPGSTHIVTYEATDGCGNVESCSFEINVESITTNTSYCTSAAAISLNYYIDSVVLGQLNNRSGDNGGYGDFTSECHGVDQNQSYSLQLDPGYEGQPDDKVYWKVWIDYNQDGIFGDGAEYVAFGCGTNTMSGIIVMPQILAPGETRMRVIMKPGSYATGPCENYQYGETEDYCLTIWGTGNISDSDVLDSRSKTLDHSPVLLTKEQSITDFEIYPNPAVDFININIVNYENVGGINIYNNQGKIVKKVNNINIGQNNNIDVSTLNSGMYLVSILNEDGSQISKKIMIQK